MWETEHEGDVLEFEHASPSIPSVVMPIAMLHKSWCIRCLTPDRQTRWTVSISFDCHVSNDDRQKPLGLKVNPVRQIETPRSFDTTVSDPDAFTSGSRPTDGLCCVCLCVHHVESYVYGLIVFPQRLNPMTPDHEGGRERVKETNLRQ